MLKGEYSLNLSYASSTPKRPWANFGDSLNPILMHLLTGLMINHANFNENAPRLSAIGTILQDFSKGDLDVWGTGLDVTKTSAIPSLKCFNPLKTDINYKIHAVRGAVTDTILNSFGIKTKGVYGDPAILLKKMLHSYVGSKKNGKIGVVCHLSELESYDDRTIPKKDIIRYQFESDNIKLISTIVKPDHISILEKIKEIASCSYIISTSLHGLIIADIFNTPCAYLSSAGLSHDQYSIYDYRSIIDHRFRDYYSGMRQATLPVFFAPTNKTISVNEVIAFLETQWKPLRFLDEIAEELVGALPLRVNGYHDHLSFPDSLSQLKL